MGCKVFAVIGGNDCAIDGFEFDVAYVCIGRGGLLDHYGTLRSCFDSMRILLDAAPDDGFVDLSFGIEFSDVVLAPSCTNVKETVGSPV